MVCCEIRREPIVAPASGWRQENRRQDAGATDCRRRAKLHESGTAQRAAAAGGRRPEPERRRRRMALPEVRGVGGAAGAGAREVPLAGAWFLDTPRWNK